MPAPVVLNTAESSTNTAGTSHTVNLPFATSTDSAKHVGKTLVIVLNKGSTAATVNALAGWNELADENTGGGMYIAWRKVDGTEGTTTVFTTSGNTRSAEIVYLIDSAADPDVTAPTISTVATGTSTAPNATSVTVPTGTNQSEFLIISAAGMAGEEADDDTWANTAPTGYTGLLQKSCGTAGASLGGLVMSATRLIGTTAEDAGAFNVDVSAAWRAFSVAVAGATQATATVDRGDAFLLLGPGGLRKLVKYSPQVAPAAPFYDESYGGEITPTGALTKAVAKNLSGGFTPAATLVKDVSKLLAGSITPSGALSTIRTFVSSLSGSITPAGAVSKDVSAVRDGSTAPTGSVTDNVTKTLTGAFTPSGAAAKGVGKLLGGSIAPSGALTAIIQFLVSLAGAITPSGAVSKDVSAFRGGSTGPTGSVTDNVTKTLTGDMTPTGAPTKGVGKNLSGSITPTGSLANLILETILLAGSITPTGTVTNAVGKFVGGTVVPAGSLTKAVGKFLVGAFTPSGAVFKTVGKNLGGAFTPSGALTNEKVVQLLLDGVITPIGNLTKAVGKFLSGAVVPQGLIVKDVAKFLVGVITPTGIISLGGTAIDIFGSVSGGLLDRFRSSGGDREGPDSTSSGDRPHSYAGGGDRRFDE